MGRDWQGFSPFYCIQCFYRKRIDVVYVVIPGVQYRNHECLPLYEDLFMKKKLSIRNLYGNSMIITNIILLKKVFALKTLSCCDYPD